MEYSLVFKYAKDVKLYISDFNEDGCILHKRDEKEALKFYNLEEALLYHNLGYGIETRVSPDCENAVKTTR